MSGLPGNWVVLPIGDLISLNPKIQCSDELSAGFVPMQMVGKEYSSPIRFETRPWGEIKKGYTHFSNGDVLLAKITPCFENGKAGLVCGLPNGVGAGSTEYFVSRPHLDMLNSRYLYAFLKTDKFLKAGAVQMTGSVGHKRVPKDYLLETELPLAPLNEQKRIADKLDAVLARVDACRDRLDRIPAILKRFHQSVLAAATSGKLTTDWRVERKLSDPITTSLGEWCDVLGGKRLPKGFELTNEDTGYPYVRVTDFAGFSVKLAQLRFVPGEAAEVIKRYIINSDDVYISIAGTIGLVGQVPHTISGSNLTENAARIVVREGFVPRFLMYQLAAPAGQDQMQQKKIATTQDKLGLFRIKELELLKPSIEEQTEIIRRVEVLFACADHLEARHTAARAQFEKLTPSTLAKAFRGELVPQDPNDEPASALLHRIHAQRSDQAANKPSRSRREQG